MLTADQKPEQFLLKMMLLKMTAVKMHLMKVLHRYLVLELL